MKHLISLMELTESSIIELLDLADDVKRNSTMYSSHLKGKSIALLFQKTSTRTRISFESGMYQLGGNVIYLDWRTTNIHLGALPDEIRCMSDYVSMIMARVNEHETLNVIRAASKVPVINGLSNLCHPCQTLSDLMTIRERFGSFNGVSVAWLGDGNNVCNSLIVGCVLLNIPIHVATPSEYRPNKEILSWVKKHVNSQQLLVSEDPKDAVKEANVVYTDAFVSMGQERETEERLKVFKPYQVNEELLSHSRNDPYIMHCLPAHRGIEITDKVLDSERSIVFQQAENRRHLQKALMLKLLGRD